MKHIILSVNDNPKYLYFLPLTCWTWRRLGWNPIIFFCGKMDRARKLIPDFDEYNIREVLVYDPFKSSTIAQVARLFGACVAEGMIMTGDIDMLALSDYWQPNPGGVTCYGRDLTDYHYPICYIAMEDYDWKVVMNIQSNLYGVHLRRDLRQQKNEWVLDQDIITERLLECGKENITHVSRGTDKRTGYPVGRVDRSHWTLKHDVFIDAHLPHDVLTNEASFKKVLELLHTVWPNEDFKWFIDYHKNFKKLL